jgi:hypothetical protein
MVPLLALALVALAVGCGGDDEPTTGATGAPGTGETTEARGSDSAEGEGNEAGAEGGGGAGVPPVRTSSSSKTAFLKQANAGCQRAKRNLANESESYLAKNSVKGPEQNNVLTEMVKAVLLPSFERELTAIAEAGAPPGEEQAVEALLAAGRSAIQEAEDAEEINSNEQLAIYFKKLSADLAKYGLSSCINAIE